MKDIMRKGDHYVEYLLAAKRVEELEKLIVGAMAIDEKIDTTEASLELGKAMSERDEAKDKYNAMVFKMRDSLDGMRKYAHSEFTQHLVNFLELAVNITPIEEEQINVVQNLHS